MPDPSRVTEPPKVKYVPEVVSERSTKSVASPNVVATYEHRVAGRAEVFEKRHRRDA
jgi:hypothetical protein